MRRTGVMATLWNFASEDAKLLDMRYAFKPALTGFRAEQDVPFCSVRDGVRYRPYRVICVHCGSMGVRAGHPGLG